jgi:uncharacterized OsmC-like protein
LEQLAANHFSAFVLVNSSLLPCHCKCFNVGRKRETLHDDKVLHFQTTAQTADSTKPLTLSTLPAGHGSSINGGELLFLALATCFCNDIYRDATRMSLRISGVEVVVRAEFSIEGEPGSYLQFRANVRADASPEQIEALLAQTNKAAGTHNTLRNGVMATIMQGTSQKKPTPAKQ